MSATSSAESAPRYTLVAIIYALCLLTGILGCSSLNPRKQRLELEVSRLPSSNVVDVVIKNRSGENIRIWDIYNSWGWRSFTVFFRDQTSGKLYIVKRRQVTAWTVNVPVFVEIRPSESARFSLKLADGWWVLPDGLDLARKQYFVRVQLIGESSPEAAELGVFVGKARSPWVAN
jgi:hypothetical protein